MRDVPKPCALCANEERDFRYTQNLFIERRQTLRAQLLQETFWARSDDYIDPPILIRGKRFCYDA